MNFRLNKIILICVIYYYSIYIFLCMNVHLKTYKSLHIHIIGLSRRTAFFFFFLPRTFLFTTPGLLLISSKRKLMAGYKDQKWYDSSEIKNKRQLRLMWPIIKTNHKLSEFLFFRHDYSWKLQKLSDIPLVLHQSRQ